MTVPAAERDRLAGHPPSLELTGTAVASPGALALPLSSQGGGEIAVLSRSKGSGRRRRRRPAVLLSFLVMVALPLALAGVYLFFVAADQYVAEFRFALRSAEPEPRDPTAFFLDSPAPSLTLLNSFIVAQYLASRAVVDDLTATLDLRAMFSRPEADWLARLDLPVSVEELVKYWKRQVDAFFDVTNGTIVVRARAFTREDALSLAEAILAASERLVNELSVRARRDTLHNAKEEVGRAEKRLKSALARLRDFRDEQGIIDPRKTADATNALASRVRDELVRADTELSTLKHYMREDAPS
ncbi:MAG: hypothetical protein JO139_03770, partial [Alphaproteobacteria bacterium]|nr:hypothetical protein [Alphaproteobacteria bacterium]